MQEWLKTYLNVERILTISKIHSITIPFILSNTSHNESLNFYCTSLLLSVNELLNLSTIDIWIRIFG